MSGRCAVAPGRAVLRSSAARTALGRGVPPTGALAEGTAAVAAAALRRGYAAGPNFQGFPFGGGQAPPRGDSDKFYRLLGIDRGADEAEVKKAYKTQAKKHHPDRGGDENTFKDIARAYEVLSSPEKRRIYDQYGEAGLESAEQGGGPGPGQGVDPFDLFGQIFGFNAGGTGRRTQRGRPVTPDSSYEIELSLEEIYTGTSRSIVFTREALCQECKGMGGHDQRRCGKCDGTGRVVIMQQMGVFVQQMEAPCQACSGRGYKIEAKNVCKVCKGKCTCKQKKTFSIDVEPGLENGSEFRFRGQADEAPGHDAGDVVIAVKEKNHKVFQRVKENLLMKKTVTLAEALCGFEISTTFLDGSDLVIRSTPGQVVKPGDIMVISGKGMPRRQGQRPGDLFLVLEVDFPSTIGADEQGKLLEALGSTPLPPAPPLAEVGKKLTPQEVQNLRRRVTQASQQQASASQSQASCVQQ